MYKFWATFCKELLLLSRDKGGVLVLFVMPAVLVLVVSLVQNNVLEATGEGSIRVLFVDREEGALGEKIRQGLLSSGALALVSELDGKPVTDDAARKAVSRGDFQFCILIPEGATAALHRRAGDFAERAMAGEGERATSGAAVEEAVPLTVYFDPTVQGVFRTAVTSSLERVVQGVEAEEKARVLSASLKKSVARILAQRLSPMAVGQALAEFPDLQAAWGRESLLAVRPQVAAGEGEKAVLTPNAVQQNVPAWALFGMFFIVVPLSGNLIRERQEGTLQRLLSIPVSSGSLLAGKLLAYVAVCLVQFALMLLVGKTLLPLFGTPVLELGDQLPAVAFLALCAALAAAGYGLLIGTLVRSYEQASMFGAVSVVVAAALGGIMVPVYVMPKAMQALSILSPLGWGLEGFLEIFVRRAGFLDIIDNALSLLAFFTLTLAIAWASFYRRYRGGR
jgi:ABC-2 type transport system permease protein